MSGGGGFGRAQDDSVGRVGAEAIRHGSVLSWDVELIFLEWR